MRDRWILPALILGASLIISALLLSNTWVRHQKSRQTLEVTGSATLEFVADFALLRCSWQGEGPTPAAAFQDLERQRPPLLDFLKSKGFQDDAFELTPPTTWSIQEYDAQGRDTGRVLKYVYRQQLTLRSGDVQSVRELSLQLTALVDQGVYAQPEPPQYHFSGLDSLKIGAQEAATHNASERAARIAHASGGRLGPLRGARMGVLQITPRHSTTISDYGVLDLSSIEKEITAVAHLSFTIE